jgi:CheY-like chemotaxis protein
MLSVLLVEAHRDTADLYDDFLTTMGFDVQIATNSDDARQLASVAEAVVTGIQIPGSMNGFELIRALRRDPATCDLTIIVLSACAFPADAAKASAAGGDAFLAKPCLPVDLAIEIRHAASRRRRRRSAVVPGEHRDVQRRHEHR